jgi:hypothetical protein
MVWSRADLGFFVKGVQHFDFYGPAFAVVVPMLSLANQTAVSGSFGSLFRLDSFVIAIGIAGMTAAGWLSVVTMP